MIKRMSKEMRREVTGTKRLLAQEGFTTILVDPRQTRRTMPERFPPIHYNDRLNLSQVPCAVRSAITRARAASEDETLPSMVARALMGRIHECE